MENNFCVLAYRLVEFSREEQEEYLVKYWKKENKTVLPEKKKLITTGKKMLLDSNPLIDQLEILLENIENSNRKVLLIKAREGYHTFRELIRLYCAEEILSCIEKNKPGNLKRWLLENMKQRQRKKWKNVGGQLIEEQSVNKLIQNIITNKTKSWDDIHQFYHAEAGRYAQSRLEHAVSSYMELFRKPITQKDQLIELLNEAFQTKSKLLKNMTSSREKDYTSSFRTMAYDNRQEMDTVTGKLEENSFIIEQTAALKRMKAQISKFKKK